MPRIQGDTPPPLVYRKLSLCGGSTRGFGYIGVVRELWHLNQLDHIHTVAGTSVGSIVGLLIATGWSYEKIEAVYELIDPKTWTYIDIKDDPENVVPLNQFKKHFIEPNQNNLTGFLKKSTNLQCNYGLHEGNIYLQFFRCIIKEATQCPSCLNNEDNCKVKDPITEQCIFGKEGNARTTFEQWEQLKNAYPEKKLKTLIVDAARMIKGYGSYNEEFSYRTHLKNVEVALAINASKAMHGYFTSVIINGSRFNDGGVLNNYPIDRIIKNKEVFDPECFGVWLSDETKIRLIENKARIYEHDLSDIHQQTISSWREHTSATFSSLSDPQTHRHTESPYAKHTIHLDTLGIDMFDMDINEEKKRELRISGQYAVIRWLCMQHLDIAKQFYHPMLIEHVIANQFTPSTQQFTKDYTIKFKDLKLKHAQDDDDILTHWQPSLDIIDVLRRHPDQVEPEKPLQLIPFPEPLRSAQPRFLPIFHRIAPELQTKLVDFVRYLQTMKDSLTTKPDTEQVVLALNNQRYPKAMLMDYLRGFYRDKDPQELMNVVQPFLISSGRPSEEGDPTGTGQNKPKSGCIIM